MKLHEPATDCDRCPRLSQFRAAVKATEPGYFCAPVPSFGDAAPRLLIVGLAPGRHGANRTGRPFTGDYAGVLLYQTLFDFGWSSQPGSVSADDPLHLRGARITNAVRCLPPENKPRPEEVRQCNEYLAAELAALPPGAAVLALGAIAFGAVLRAGGRKPASAPFAHGARAELAQARQLFASYHCSRYNTQTRRLSSEMFRQVFAAIEAHFVL
ncbi:MAG: uracil-DNA glycosylase [Betaproteobacteria bacterium]|nr:uracil-DNA glycosylase [Betaproteobacteria bacterium]